MKDNGSRFYYSRLTDGEKNLYDRICEALLRFEPALSVHAGMGKAFTVDTKKIMTAVLFDNPVFFYLDRRRVITKQTPMYIQLVFQYDYTKEEAEKLWAEVENRIELFIKNSIKPISFSTSLPPFHWFNIVYAGTRKETTVFQFRLFRRLPFRK